MLYYQTNPFSLRKVLLLPALLGATALFYQCSSGSGSQKSPLGLFYHDQTAHYNGYFLANLTLTQAYNTLEDDWRDDYSDILSLYKYGEKADGEALLADMEKVITKATLPIQLHPDSKWV